MIPESFSIPESNEKIQGKWVKYGLVKRDEGYPTANKIAHSLDGKETGWCILNPHSAKHYIEEGDIYIYYSNDENGDPNNPRLFIPVNKIGIKPSIEQIYGILPALGVEPILQHILDDKLKEFGAEADPYRKRCSDMHKLTVIENKISKNEQLNKDDLVFLYEIDSLIESFGVIRDPRIAKIKTSRNADEDMLTIFECRADQIAHSPDQIKPDTKAYIGNLNMDVIYRLQTLDHIYTSFPTGKVFIETIHCEDVKIKDLINKMIKENIYITFDNHTVYENLISHSFLEKDIKVIGLTVKSLGFNEIVEFTDLLKKIKDTGLGLCPPEVALYYRIKHRDLSRRKIVALCQSEVNNDICEFNISCSAKTGPSLTISRHNARFLPNEIILLRMP
jgi:hypothetical protein